MRVCGARRHCGSWQVGRSWNRSRWRRGHAAAVRTVHRLAQRAPRNQVVVAIAIKLARIAWAVLSSGQDYRHQPLQQLAAA